MNGNTRLHAHVAPPGLVPRIAIHGHEQWLELTQIFRLLCVAFTTCQENVILVYLETLVRRVCESSSLKLLLVPSILQVERGYGGSTRVVWD